MKRNLVSSVSFILILFLLPWSSITKMVYRNVISTQTFFALYYKSIQMITLEEKYWESAKEDCKAYWIAGLLDNAMGYKDRQLEAWTQAADCSLSYINMMRAVDPFNHELAEMAIQKHPENAVGWFWLAKLVTKEAPERAIMMYQRGLEIKPKAAVPWCRLGLLLSKYDLPAAVKASMNCCLLGDPGVNGCYQAGMYTERQGDLETAIKYYRLSTWSRALDRADEIEKQFLTNP